jgi:hypothetical protein
MKNLLSERYRRSLKFAFREIDGTFIIVSPEEMSLGAAVTYFTLNEVGKDIWNRLDGTKTVGQVLEEMLCLYDVKREQLARDIGDFLCDMEGKGVVIKVEASDG